MTVFDNTTTMINDIVRQADKLIKNKKSKAMHQIIVFKDPEQFAEVSKKLRAILSDAQPVKVTFEKYDIESRYAYHSYTMTLEKSK